jgi:Ca2+-binding RTX toxin-like protein
MSIPGTLDDDYFFPTTTGNDTIFGSLGSDFIDGREGSDTIDYNSPLSGFRGEITIKPVGVISKKNDDGSIDEDTLRGIETIIGNADRINSIDASTAPGGAFINVNLSNNIQNNLSVFIPNGSSPPTRLTFTVRNFRNVYGTPNNDTIIGDGGDNILHGNGGNDAIHGGAGNDTIDGGSGNDFLDGGLGNDILTGADGNDSVRGDAGNDTVNGGAGNDFLDGGLGNDFLGGGSGNDTLSGGLGNDALNGGSGNDALSGGSGNDTLSGGSGNDTLSGGLGNDFLDGGLGNDVLTGDAGNDTIHGGAGDDTLNGTNAHARGFREIDSLEGGDGFDTFIIGDAAGSYYATQGNSDSVTIHDNFTQDFSIQLGSGNYSFRGDQLFSVVGRKLDLVATFVQTTQPHRRGAINVDSLPLNEDIDVGSLSAKSALDVSSFRLSEDVSSLRAKSATNVDSLILKENVAFFSKLIPQGDFSIYAGQRSGIFSGIDAASKVESLEIVDPFLLNGGVDLVGSANYKGVSSFESFGSESNFAIAAGQDFGKLGGIDANPLQLSR